MLKSLFHKNKDKLAQNTKARGERAQKKEQDKAPKSPPLSNAAAHPPHKAPDQTAATLPPADELSVQSGSKKPTAMPLLPDKQVKMIEQYLEEKDLHEKIAMDKFHDVCTRAIDSANRTMVSINSKSNIMRSEFRSDALKRLQKLLSLMQDTQEGLEIVSILEQIKSVEYTLSEDIKSLVKIDNLLNESSKLQLSTVNADNIQLFKTMLEKCDAYIRQGNSIPQEWRNAVQEHREKLASAIGIFSRDQLRSSLMDKTEELKNDIKIAETAFNKLKKTWNQQQSDKIIEFIDQCIINQNKHKEDIRASSLTKRAEDSFIEFANGEINKLERMKQDIKQYDLEQRIKKLSMPIGMSRQNSSSQNSSEPNRSKNTPRKELLDE
jgi:D-ribose pyranose/furanose isomerase RbsD